MNLIFSFCSECYAAPILKRRVLWRGVPILSLLLAGAWIAHAAVPPFTNSWQIPDKVTVMVVHAHPDDEGIFFGPALPYYASVLQVPTLDVAMTSGDWNTNNLPIRENELRWACWTYGLRYEPIWGRFRDYPSQNYSSIYTNTIDGTWDYWADGVLQNDGSDVAAGKLKAINFVAQQIRRYRPEVIITHDPKGEYGHDNHKATCYAVTNAFFVAADPAATATNLAGLAPWQAKKLYLHLGSSNRLFHAYGEIPFAELNNNATCRQLADAGLDYHVSQSRPDASTVYRTGENYDPYPFEWWGLYASTVGMDSVLSSNRSVNGFVVSNGVACGNFLENIVPMPLNRAPAFVASPIILPPGQPDQPYIGNSLSGRATDSDLAWFDVLTFSKTSGPAWLTVAPNGALGGTPSVADVYTNTFVVRVTDLTGAVNEAALTINVLPPAVTSLVGWWKLDETTGAVLADSSPYGRHGTNIGDVALNQPGATPYSGSSARFSMTNKVDVAYSPQLNPTNFTVSLWAKVTGGAGTYRSPLTSRESSPTAGYVFYAANNNTWQFWLGPGGASWKTLSGGPVVTNVWIHLVGTYDGSTAKFYTNGVLAASAATPLLVNQLYPLRIAAGATESAGNYWFPGFVDDVRIYSGAFDAPKVFALFADAPSVFVSNPLTRPDATAGSAYAGATLAGSATNSDPGLVFHYAKLAGPTWLAVSADGTLSGTPGSADIGTNSFTVQVVDSLGTTDTASLLISVLPAAMPPTISSATMLDSGNFQINGTGTPERPYVLLASPTLTAPIPWIPVATNIASGQGLIQFTDPSSTTNHRQFYRLSTP